ncbi:Guanine nucleotide exchange factor lte1 [Malassezia yamatoensis]|uniref:Guanine nucleotide exchange factor lte1 n=1 Tax=Malassezia yamatoensis TaxID=253288 RepID=A0AAJ5YTM9_9BASI|nr:Guanine nucleotide exchange factor lte1 [Malassezia yamatoensis]
MFLRKSRSTDTLSAKARSDSNITPKVPGTDMSTDSGKKSPRRIKSKRSLRFLRGWSKADQDSMPATSPDKTITAPSAGLDSNTPERPNAGLGILQHGSNQLPTDTDTPSSTTPLFHESQFSGRGTQLPQHRLLRSNELPQTPQQPSIGSQRLVHTPQPFSSSQDSPLSRLTSGPGSSSPSTGLAHQNSPARLYKPPNATQDSASEPWNLTRPTRSSGITNMPLVSAPQNNSENFLQSNRTVLGSIPQEQQQQQVEQQQLQQFQPAEQQQQQQRQVQQPQPQPIDALDSQFALSMPSTQPQGYPQEAQSQNQTNLDANPSTSSYLNQHGATYSEYGYAQEQPVAPLTQQLPPHSVQSATQMPMVTSSSQSAPNPILGSETNQEPMAYSHPQTAHGSESQALSTANQYGRESVSHLPTASAFSYTQDHRRGNYAAQSIASSADLSRDSLQHDSIPRASTPPPYFRGSQRQGDSFHALSANQYAQTNLPTDSSTANPASQAVPNADSEKQISSEQAHAVGERVPDRNDANLQELGPSIDQDVPMLTSSTSMAGLAIGSGPSSAEAPGASWPSSEPTTLPTSSQAETFQPSSVTRAEGMLGSALVLYDDHCVENPSGAPQTAVAWTYDDWFHASDHLATPAAVDEDVTAIVASRRPQQVSPEKYPRIMALAVFCSTLCAIRGQSCVYDMASRIPRDRYDSSTVQQANSDAPAISITTASRNQALFPENRHVVLAATPRRLVAEMTSASSPGLMEDVFLAYRSYFNAHRLQDLLISRADWASSKLQKAPIQETIVHVLRSTHYAFSHWFQTYYMQDFAPDDDLQRRMIEFAMRHVKSSDHWDLTGTDVEVRYGAHRLWQLVQTQGKSELVVQTTGSVSETPSHPVKSSPSLHKARSFTRLFGRDRREETPASPTLNRTRKPSMRRSPHVRGASGTSTYSLAAAAQPPGHARKPSNPINSDSPRSKADSIFRRNKSLRRKTKNEDSSAAATSSQDADASFASSVPASLNEFESDSVKTPSGKDSIGVKHDQAIQQLESQLKANHFAGGTERSRDGPIQWIPAHADAPWKDAQRMSTIQLARSQLKAPATPGWKQNGTLLLSQRPETIAKQLTTLEKQLLLKVSWTELLEHTWDHHSVQQEVWQREYQDYVSWHIRFAGQSQEQQNSPLNNQNVTHVLVARFNRACAWVASHIVTTQDLMERVAILSQWIRIAWDCYLLGNQATLCQIMFGLQSPWIARLQSTWSQIAPWETRVFDALRQFTSPHDQFTSLRLATLNTLNQTASDLPAVTIPFWGIFVSDLTMNDTLSLYVDTHLEPSMIPFYDDLELSQSWDTLLNVYRLRVKARIARDFMALQDSAAEFEEVQMDLPLLAEALQLDTLSATQIQSASLSIQP